MSEEIISFFSFKSNLSSYFFCHPDFLREYRVVEFVGNKLRFAKFVLALSPAKNCFLNWSNFPPEIMATFLVLRSSERRAPISREILDLLSVTVPSRSKINSFFVEIFLSIFLYSVAKFF